MTATELPETSPEPPGKHRRFVNTAAVVAALAGGGVVGAVVGAPLISAAQDDDAPTESTTPTESGDTDDADGTRGGGSDSDGADGGGTSDDDGSEREECGPGHGRFHLPFIGGPWLDTAAEMLDMEADELRDRLADGDSLADVAEEQGVDTDELTAAIVAEVEAVIDDQVEDGHIDEDDAQEIKDALNDGVTQLIDGDWPALGSMRDLEERLPELRDEVEGWLDEHEWPDRDWFDGDRPTPPWHDSDRDDSGDAEGADDDPEADDTDTEPEPEEGDGGDEAEED